MADFGGWSMPIEYPGPGGGVMAEHRAVRERVGIFDVSHLGKIRVVGVGALGYLNSILTNDLEAIADGGAQYTLLCNEAGGVIDDLIAYRIDSEEIFLIPNASNCAQVHQLLAANAPAGLMVENLHRQFAVFAIQGPNSRQLLQAIGVRIPSTLSYMTFLKHNFNAREVIVCRTGYTGEQGFELVVPVEGGVAREVWERLMKELPSCDGLVAGLGARDTLRTEMGYALHGHELSVEINPWEAGVGWAVAMDKARFIGKDALQAMKSLGTRRRTVALRALDKTIPRAGMPVKRGDSEIGVVTSGTFSPNLKTGIALALVTSETKIGERVTVDVRGRVGEYEVVKAPFLPSRVR